MIKVKTKKIIDVFDWDDLVKETYGKPYSFQQQDGCQGRGMVHLSVPYDEADENDANMAESIPEVVNGSEMGVKFESWLKRDPKEPVDDRTEDWEIKLFWQRNFYPNLEVLANDLHKKGLLEAGEYEIEINW